MKAYTITTGVIFALFALGHVAELIADWRPVTSDPWFVFGLAAIILASAGLSAWAFTLTRRAR